jgi:hypothetical protein
VAETRAGIAMGFESRGVLRTRYRRVDSVRYPKPGLGRRVFMSLLMCFPLTCMMWAAIIYGAFRLAR